MTDHLDEDTLRDLLEEKLNDLDPTKEPLEDLEPISPEEAVNQYLKSRSNELRPASLSAHRSALDFFIDWCKKEDIENLNDLAPNDLHKYRLWRRDDATTKVDTLSKKSEKTQQDIIRVFIAFCEDINAVKTGLHEAVRSPSLERGEAARDASLDRDRGETIITYLRRFEPARVHTVVLALLIETGARTGELHSLDVDDYHPNHDPPHLEFEHRPETGTTLKNGGSGNRPVGISQDVCEIIDEYLEHERPDVTDEHGREPLLTAGNGRLSTSTIRKYAYMWTRPCAINHDCPHGRTSDDCEATCNDSASKCPSSRSPHAIRRGYITRLLRKGVDHTFVSERCNVSEDVVNHHYDNRSDRERMAHRFDILRDIDEFEDDNGNETK